MSSCSLMFRKCTIKIKILIIIVMSQFVYSMHTEKFHQVSHGMGKGPGMEISMFAKGELYRVWWFLETKVPTIHIFDRIVTFGNLSQNIHDYG